MSAIPLAIAASSRGGGCSGAYHQACGCASRARLLRLSKLGLETATVEQTDHFKVMREFCGDPAGFVEGVMAE